MLLNWQDNAYILLNAWMIWREGDISSILRFRNRVLALRHTQTIVVIETANKRNTEGKKFLAASTVVLGWYAQTTIVVGPTDKAALRSLVKMGVPRPVTGSQPATH